MTLTAAINKVKRVANVTKERNLVLLKKYSILVNSIFLLKAYSSAYITSDLDAFMDNLVVSGTMMLAIDPVL